MMILSPHQRRGVVTSSLSVLRLGSATTTTKRQLSKQTLNGSLLGYDCCHHQRQHQRRRRPQQQPCYLKQQQILLPFSTTGGGLGEGEGRTNVSRRYYYTNGNNIKKNDPYCILGLSYGDGASTSDIKNAFREKARLLHPDVNTTDTPQQALEKFQQLQKAYETIMKQVTGGNVGGIDAEEWSYAIWRQSDRIALDRTDVAGVARKRPIQPISKSGKNHFGNLLGHPSGRGIIQTRGEYLANGASSIDGEKPRKSSSVGRGQNKWVKPKEFVPWDSSSSAATTSKSKSNSAASSSSSSSTQEESK